MHVAVGAEDTPDARQDLVSLIASEGFSEVVNRHASEKPSLTDSVGDDVDILTDAWLEKVSVERELGGTGGRGGSKGGGGGGRGGGGGGGVKRTLSCHVFEKK